MSSVSDSLPKFLPALSGIRVLELSGLAPAPFCGMILADFGAEVIRIDRVESSVSPVPDRFTRGKKSLALNLKSKEGIEILLKMVDKADVFLEPFRPGVMERLGCGPEVVMQRNARIIYARLTGWGQTGGVLTLLDGFFRFR